MSRRPVETLVELLLVAMVVGGIFLIIQSVLKSRERNNVVVVPTPNLLNPSVAYSPFRQSRVVDQFAAGQPFYDTNVHAHNYQLHYGRGPLTFSDRYPHLDTD